MNTAQDVKVARKAARTIHTIERNQRLGRYQGRNAASTDRWLARLLDRRADALRRLPRSLSGLLTEERILASRISEAKDNGQDRPELRARLNRIRRQVRVEVAS